MKSLCRRLFIMVITASLLTIISTVEGPSLLADERAPIPAADLVNDGKLKLEFSGTGKTIGHVMDVKLINLTGTPIEVALPPMLLVSASRDSQDYAAPSGQTANVGGGASVTVPIIGVCLIRTRPAVGEGVTGETIAMTSNGESLNSLPEDFVSSEEQQEELGIFTTENVGELLIIAESYFIAAEELQDEGKLEAIPYPDPKKKEEIVVEWGVWADPEIATILDQEPATQEDLGEVINDQVAEQFEDEVPPAVQEKVDIGIVDIFASVELTQERAKKIRQENKLANSDGGEPSDNGLNIGDRDSDMNDGPGNKKDRSTKNYVPFKTTKKKDGSIVSTKTEDGTTTTVTQYPNGIIKIEQRNISSGNTHIVIFDKDSIETKIVDKNGKLLEIEDSQTQLGKTSPIIKRIVRVIIKKGKNHGRWAYDANGKEVEMTPKQWQEFDKRGSYWHTYHNKNASKFSHALGTLEDMPKGGTKLTVRPDKLTTLEWEVYQDGSTSRSTKVSTNKGKTRTTTTIKKDPKGNWTGTTATTTGDISQQSPTTTTTVYKKINNGETKSTTTTKTPDDKVVETTETVYRSDGTIKQTTYVGPDAPGEVIITYDKNGKPSKVKATRTETITTTNKNSGLKTVKKYRYVLNGKIGKDGTITATEDIYEGDAKKPFDNYPEVVSSPKKKGRVVKENRKKYAQSAEYDQYGRRVKMDGEEVSPNNNERDPFSSWKLLLKMGIDFIKPSPKLPTSNWPIPLKT